MEDFDEWSREKELTLANITTISNLANIWPWFRVISMNEKAIGFINMNPNSGLDDCRADLAYALDYKYWAKVLFTLAIKMVISKIFLEWPLLQRLCDV